MSDKIDPNQVLSDKQFMQSFAKGVMTARGIDPEKYDIIVTEKGEVDWASILVFTFIMQLVLFYASYKFTDMDLFWSLTAFIHFVVFPFTFTLVPFKKLMEIAGYAFILVIVSGAFDFILFLLDTIDRMTN